MPIAVKDLIDTGDMPTAYGSTIYAGHQLADDAAVVAVSRAANGLVLGKSVTTNCLAQSGADNQPAQSRSHPRRFVQRIGGGCRRRSGDTRFRHPDGRLGDRPAAYCRVAGFKPTRGTYSTAGVKPLSPYLDTVGLFARAVADIVLFDGALRESAPPATAPRRPRCGFFIPIATNWTPAVRPPWRGPGGRLRRLVARLSTCPIIPPSKPWSISINRS